VKCLWFERLANTDGLPEVAGRLFVLVEASEINSANIRDGDGLYLEVLVLRNTYGKLKLVNCVHDCVHVVLGGAHGALQGFLSAVHFVPGLTS
jgi:hypothetical protein